MFEIFDDFRGWHCLNYRLVECLVYLENKKVINILKETIDKLI